MKRSIDVKRNFRPNPITNPSQYAQWKVVGLLPSAKEAIESNKSKSQFILFLRILSRNVTTMIALAIFLILVFCVIIIPETTKYSPTQVNLEERGVQPFDNNHLLGTDPISGVDIWAQLWHGARYSLGLSTTAAVLILFIGTLIGLLMGYFRNFDKMMLYIILILQNMPTLPLLIVLILLFGSNFAVIVLVFGLTGWIGLALQVRAQVIRNKSYEWVTASKVLGTGSWKIVKSLLPPAIPIILTVMILAIPNFILGEITLSVLGLTSPDQPSLGILINQALDVVLTNPGNIAIPSLILTLLTSSLLIFGNGLQDAIRRTR